MSRAKQVCRPASGSRRFSSLSPVFFQPKLSVSEPDDSYEREANTMSDIVLGMSSAKNENAFFSPVNHSAVLKKSEGSQNINTKAPRAVHDVINSPGSPMDKETRNFFEPRFDRDFSNVRIHNDSSAAKSAQSINAHAYTSGNNIVFNKNQYSPQTDSGKKLLAHELTHVVQQNNNFSLKGVQRKSYVDCNETQKTTFDNAHTKAKSMLSKAVELVSEPSISAKTEIAIKLAFGNALSPTVETVKKALTDTKNNFDSATFECEAGHDYFCGKGILGYVRTIPAYVGWANIHLCVDNLASYDDLQASLTMIHEAIHRYAFAGDQAYYAVDGTTRCIITNAVEMLSVSAALDNADSYTCFVQMVNSFSYTEMSDLKDFLEGKTITEIYMSDEASNIDLDSSDSSLPFFKLKLAGGLKDASQIPGIQMRWVIEGNDGKRYLMLSYKDEQVFQYGLGETHGITIVGLKTRALLKERGIKKGKVLCRILLPRTGDQLFTHDVNFSWK